jgi:hypothetical protein
MKSFLKKISKKKLSVKDYTQLNRVKRVFFGYLAILGDSD